MSEPYPVTGYVLAGGKSSRMGRDKALLELGGKTLVERAVEKLGAVCGATYILSGREELAAYAPLVADVHPGCGPLGGMEAALLHTATDWNLFLAVDMPFIPVKFLTEWVRRVLLLEDGRVALFTVDDIAQPTMCMAHRAAAPFVSAALGRGEFRVLTTLRAAAEELAGKAGAPLDRVLLERAIPGHGLFANVNTPEEFALAEARAPYVYGAS